MNNVLAKLPGHLFKLIIDQPYNEYTAQDHAIWRYVMRRNVRYLTRVAHGSYLEGLERTGVSVEQIPHMYGMNRILGEIGWAAAAVDGFIPPSAFMEFQAYSVLVIAADIRPIDQIEYTPAPDIIHEAAGHAPIIADPAYADYLREFGRIGSKAISSARDYDMYTAIRHLSILKTDPNTQAMDIREAEKAITAIQAMVEPASEMSKIRNLHWWTVEYGLIGDLQSPKIYGAGLLSSIGESYSALQDEVQKIPYSIDAASFGFDITTRQPQLFVTPDFNHLMHVLNEYADTMAMSRGGPEGIAKAIGSCNTATCVYSSGLQVSGTFTAQELKDGKVIYLNTTGPTTLNYDGQLLEGHDKSYHTEGFGSPVGKIKTSSMPLEQMPDGELASLGIITGEHVKLEFESGVSVNGVLERVLRNKGRIILMTFRDCKVSYRDSILFAPSWGTYDMAIGEKIISVYNGPADADGFALELPVPVEKTHKISFDRETRTLHKLYQRVRDLREDGMDPAELENIWQEVKSSYPDDWLLPLEIIELAGTPEFAGLKEPAGGLRFAAPKEPDTGLANEIRDYLDKKKLEKPELGRLIEAGYKLTEQP